MLSSFARELVLSLHIGKRCVADSLLLSSTDEVSSARMVTPPQPAWPHLTGSSHGHISARMTTPFLTRFCCGSEVSSSLPSAWRMTRYCFTKHSNALCLLPSFVCRRPESYRRSKQVAVDYVAVGGLHHYCWVGRYEVRCCRGSVPRTF